MNGRCTCGTVRFSLLDQPLIVHCCHCTWCQRETGSAFAVNAVIETARLRVDGPVEEVVTPSASPAGQIVARCPACRGALWSHYSGSGRLTAFVRVGTLDDPGACPPDIHIFTTTRQPWFTIPAGVPACAEFYDIEAVWRPDALVRYAAMRGRDG